MVDNASQNSTDNDTSDNKKSNLIFPLLSLFLLLIGTLFAMHSCTTSSDKEMEKTVMIKKGEARKAIEKEEAKQRLKAMGISNFDMAVLLFYRDSETLHLLITAGANVNMEGWEAQTPLYQAAAEGLTECVKLLLAAPGIDVNKADKYGDTPLNVALWNGHTECAELIRAAGGLETQKTKEKAKQQLKAMGISYYDSAILEAYDSPKTLYLLITAGANVNITDTDNVTTLYKAACNGKTQCVKLLLAAPGINVNKTRYTTSPLYEAAYNGHKECVKLLLNAPGIDIREWNQISIAVLQNDLNSVKELILSGTDVNKEDLNGETPLYWAARYGLTECVRLLLAAPGIDVNKEGGKYDMTPLCAAAKNGHTECVRLLLTTPGIDVNKEGEFDKTPLCEAAEEGHTECLKLLLAAPGIDVNKADFAGKTPLCCAIRGKTECVKLLLAVPGINVNQADKSGITPLQLAAKFGLAECLKLLLSSPDIDVNLAVAPYGIIPLKLAAYEGHTECVRLLLAAPGIDVNKTDEQGYTPLDSAIVHPECAKLIRAAGGKRSRE